MVEREINERLILGAEFFGNSPKERRGRSDVAFILGGTWKLSNHVNLLFTGGRDIVGDNTRDGLRRIAAPYEVNMKLISICVAKTGQ